MKAGANPFLRSDTGGSAFVFAQNRADFAEEKQKNQNRDARPIDDDSEPNTGSAKEFEQQLRNPTVQYLIAEELKGKSTPSASSTSSKEPPIANTAARNEGRNPPQQAQSTVLRNAEHSSTQQEQAPTISQAGHSEPSKSSHEDNNTNKPSSGYSPEMVRFCKQIMIAGNSDKPVWVAESLRKFKLLQLQHRCCLVDPNNSEAFFTTNFPCVLFS
mgnify:CR=1 FL=1